MSRLRSAFHSVLWKVRIEDEVAQELDFHVEMRARELVARGMSPEEARAAAVALRSRKDGDEGQMPLDKFIDKVKTEIQDKQ